MLPTLMPGHARERTKDQIMRKRTLAGLLLAGLVLGCDNKAPSGPSSVTVQTPATTTTTSAPGSISTTTISTTTTTPIVVPPPTTMPIVTSRLYVSFGQGGPTIPSILTIVLQPIPNTTPMKSRVQGVYQTPNGAGGRVLGELIGTLDDGQFDGSLTYETPECFAERLYGGPVNAQFLRWTSGPTAEDSCKNRPLDYNTLVMARSDAPLPPPTIPPTTSLPLQCSFGLSANSVAIDSSGGQRTVGVTTGPTCTWTAQTFVDWITLQPASGVGAGTVVLTIAPNPGPPRSATVVIAGVPFVVNQGVVAAVQPLPDLIPYASTDFCQFSSAGTLLLNARNQGGSSAGTSLTRVIFDLRGPTGAEFVDTVTPGLAAGSTVPINVTIPTSCRNISNSNPTPCDLVVTVDAGGSVAESNESNNSVNATCTFTP